MIERWKDGKLRKETQKARLNRLYSVKKKGFKRVAEELKQRIKAKLATVKKHTQRVKQYRQNRLFQSNQSKFYEELDGGRDNYNIIPNKEESRKFWADIWEKETVHNIHAEWINDVEAKIKPKKQQDIHLDFETVRKRIHRV